jgi:hypothetical protein
MLAISDRLDLDLDVGLDVNVDDPGPWSTIPDL